MVNCGYPIRFLMSRKENLNLLVKKFPPAPNVFVVLFFSYYCTFIPSKNLLR